MRTLNIVFTNKEFARLLTAKKKDQLKTKRRNTWHQFILLLLRRRNENGNKN